MKSFPCALLWNVDRPGVGLTGASSVSQPIYRLCNLINAVALSALSIALCGEV